MVHKLASFKLGKACLKIWRMSLTENVPVVHGLPTLLKSVVSITHSLFAK
jgi:hypothetical protein